MTSYHLFAFYDHHQPPPKSIFLNEREKFYYPRFAFIFIFLENHPRGSYQLVQLSVLKNPEASAICLFLPCGGYLIIATDHSQECGQRKRAEVRAVTTRKLQSLHRTFLINFFN